MGVLRALVSVLSSQQPFAEVRRELEQMLRLTTSMTELADRIYWGKEPDKVTGRRRLFEQDIDVNRGERRLRKQLAAYSVAGTQADAMYALQLMSLVKDVERIGDYAKNLAELPELTDDPLPADHEVIRRLEVISAAVLELCHATIEAIVSRDSERAHQLTRQGRKVAKDCEDAVKACASSDLGAGLAVRMAVGARFYKRIAAHQLNILSSLIMPLHKLDYFDDKAD